MFAARLLVLLLPLLSTANAERSKKPVRAAAVSDPQPTPAATRVPNYEPAPYSSLFRPENLDLTGFFGHQFIHTKQHPGVDLNSLYAQYGSPHQHFAFAFPNKGSQQPSFQLRQPSPQEYIIRKQKVPQAPQKVEVPISANIPNKQASEENGHYYAQAPAYAHQQAFAHQQGGAPQPQYQFVASQPAYPRPQAPVYYTQSRPHVASHQVAPVQQQFRPSAHYQAAYPSPAPSAQPPQYATQFQDSSPYAHPQAEAPQQLTAAQQAAIAGKPPKFDIQAVIQTQVLPQLKNAQGIQLLDLSEFYPQKEGRQPTYYQVHPSEDFKTASFTPVDLNSFYQQQQQLQQQQLQSAKTSSSIPAAAIREPTLSVAELEALVHQQNGAYQPSHAGHAIPSSQPSQKPASYAYVSSSQSTGGPSRHQQIQQQIDLNAYYAQGHRPDGAGSIVYGSHPSQYAVHDVPQQQPAVYYTQQPSAPPAEEVSPSNSPSSDSQFFKSTVAKHVKRGPKPTQLAHIASPLPNPTPNPTAPSKPSKTRQLVKKPHLYGQGYSFELSG